MPSEIIEHQNNISKNANVIYIGKAEKQTILERLINQDLGGGTSIFFRKLGSVLGYKALLSTGSNYKFKLNDRCKIISWIRLNITVKYFDCDTGYEANLIKDFQSSFNYSHNPKKCEYLTNVHRKNRNIGLIAKK